MIYYSRKILEFAFLTLHFMKKTIQICIIFSFLILFIRMPDASELEPECLDIKYISSAATLIVKGEVIDVRAQKEDNGQIFTYIQVRVDEYIKGESDRVVTIKRFGGRIEENGQVVEVSDSFGTTFKVGDSGYFYLIQPATAFYNGRFYGTVCNSGVAKFLPEEKQQP